MPFGLLFWGALELHGVVDRVDGEVAAVEWERADFGYVPSALLPPGVGEGDPIHLTLSGRRRRCRGASLCVLPTPAGPVELPRSLVPRGGRVEVSTLERAACARRRER